MGALFCGSAQQLVTSCGLAGCTGYSSFTSSYTTYVRTAGALLCSSTRTISSLCAALHALALVPDAAELQDLADGGKSSSAVMFAIWPCCSLWVFKLN